MQVQVLARRARSVPARAVLAAALVVAASGSAAALHRAQRPSDASTQALAADVAASPTHRPTMTVAEPASEPLPQPPPEPEPEPQPPVPEPASASVVAPDAPRERDVGGRTNASSLPLLDLDAVATTAARTGVPPRALAAYASATLQVNAERPGCRLSWISLAGIGWVESKHGSYGGGRLQPDGSVSGPIIGPPLDGGPGVRAIRDTDEGRYDGDATWDRAVGPMQFIPTTWATWDVDANGDGVADPQHIDDAALAAGRYLCSHGGDLRDSGPWVRAIRAYNHSDSYVRAVLNAANVYADRANG